MATFGITSTDSQTDTQAASTFSRGGLHWLLAITTTGTPTMALLILELLPFFHLSSQWWMYDVRGLDGGAIGM